MSEKKPSERQREAATIELLKKLREKLCSDHISSARVAAYNLSWLQEDGLAILKETLFGQYSRTTKKAAAYGLRNMKGRMKKLATEVLEQGLNHADTTTQSACLKSLQLMRGEITVKPQSRRRPQPRPQASKRKIYDAPPYRNGNKKPQEKRTPFGR